MNIQSLRTKLISTNLVVPSIFFLLFVIYILFPSDENYDIEFPKNINTTITSSHKRIDGTKVYLIIPNTYNRDENTTTYRKNDGTIFFSVLESIGSNFNESRQNFTPEVLEKKTGKKAIIHKQIKLNQFEGYFVVGEGKTFEDLQFVIIFGDQSFITMITANCKKNDLKGKQEIIELFKSIYYEKNLQTDPFELANFSLDLSITGFKYATTASNMFIYNKSGVSDYKDLYTTSFQILTLPELSNDGAIRIMNNVIKKSKQFGITFQDEQLTQLMINGYNAQILETTITFNQKTGIVYQVILYGGQSSILFGGFAYSDEENYLDLFKKTVKSIVIK